VNCDYSIQKLLEKELVIITGRNELMPGKPLVYATSKTFMDYFGINSPDELPRLKEVYADVIVEPTQVSESEQEQAVEESHIVMNSDSSFFAVTKSGELVDGKRREDNKEQPPQSE
jgi:segregation and condensation protein B